MSDTFRIRRIIPSWAITQWKEVISNSSEEAVMDDFFGDHRGLEFIPDKETPGNLILFALYEIEGKCNLVARIYKNGITRKGGVSHPNWPASIEFIAEQLDWKKSPHELLESGWVCEEENWV